jgi:seryl-tRNA synthetase
VKVKNRKNSILKDLNQICQSHIKEYGEKVQALMQEQEQKERELEKQISTLADEIEKLSRMEDEVKLKRTELMLKYSN